MERGWVSARTGAATSAPTPATPAPTEEPWAQDLTPTGLPLPLLKKKKKKIGLVIDPIYHQIRKSVCMSCKMGLEGLYSS